MFENMNVTISLLPQTVHLPSVEAHRQQVVRDATFNGLPKHLKNMTKRTKRAFGFDKEQERRSWDAETVDPVKERKAMLSMLDHKQPPRKKIEPKSRVEMDVDRRRNVERFAETEAKRRRSQWTKEQLKNAEQRKTPYNRVHVVTTGKNHPDFYETCHDLFVTNRGHKNFTFDEVISE